MNKPKCVIYAPVDVYSGYSANARDKAKAIIELKKEEWDIKIIPCKWGDCPHNFINDNKEEWGFLNQYILQGPLNFQPDYMFWITIPSEAQPVGKWNCLITAGIESTLVPAEWIAGVNRMNTTWVSSKHSKTIFEKTQYEQRNQQNQVVGVIKLEKPIEVVMEGANLDVYKRALPNIENSMIKTLRDDIKEDFAYLYLGHWINPHAPIGEDRKNVGLLIKAFFETFKNKQNKPALILKTSGAVSSYMDRDLILRKIYDIKKTVNSENLPNIYLLHGEFTDNEINELYNHPKVKAMISLTKGEGFGRPLLEFSLIGKPIITTSWSGHIDFLNPKQTILLGGELKPVHPSVANQFLLKESSWFSPHYQEIGEALTDVYKNYDKYLPGAKTQAENNKSKFSFKAMKEVIRLELNKVPEFPKQIELKLPNQVKKITLPKLTKIENK